jgi:hypothetical protein
MKKPNAISHMTTAGFTYGWLLAMLYIGGFLLLIGLVDGVPIGFSQIFGAGIFKIYSGIIIGGIPGGALGLFEGFSLWFFSIEIEIPRNQKQINMRRFVASILIGILTGVVMAYITLPLAAEFTTSSSDMFWLSLPIPMAICASVYAVHRYMLKLSAWANMGKMKNEHKLKHQLSDTDLSDDISLSMEAQAQMNKARS